MNALQKIALTGAATLLTLEQALAAAANKDGNSLFGSTNVKEGATGTSSDLSTAVQNLIASFSGILALVALVYGIYGGFLMFTAGGDEEKVKKGRTIIMQVGIGLVVIFLANAVVRWFVGAIQG